jgi:hypothetical protein
VVVSMLHGRWRRWGAVRTCIVRMLLGLVLRSHDGNRTCPVAVRKFCERMRCLRILFGVPRLRMRPRISPSLWWGLRRISTLMGYWGVMLLLFYQRNKNRVGDTLRLWFIFLRWSFPFRFGKARGIFIVRMLLLTVITMIVLHIVVLSSPLSYWLLNLEKSNNLLGQDNLSAPGIQDTAARQCWGQPPHNNQIMNVDCLLLPQSSDCLTAG